MTIETVARAQLASDLGYTDVEGRPSDRAIAQLMRDALARWGLCPRRAILKYAREQLRAGDVDVPTDTVPDVLNRLVALGECANVAVGHEAYVVPAEPRWVSSGGGVAVLLGPVVPPKETPRLLGGGPTDVVVRVQVESEEQAAALEARGAREVSLEDWLHPPAYLRHASRRLGGAVRVDRMGLVKFWEQLVDAVQTEGSLLDNDAAVRLVVGPPGGFFGQQSTAELEGRWRDEAPDGVWCGYRRGYADSHWHPSLVSVDGEARRSLDLFDHDEWRWALLARSRAVGPEEVVQRAGDELHLTWPLPEQLRAAMDIVGVPVGAWRWRVAGDAPDLWSLLS